MPRPSRARLIEPSHRPLAHSLALPLILGLFFVFLSALLPDPALATSYRWIDDGELADAADVVAEIQVLSFGPAPARGPYPATDYVVEVKRILKGEVEGSRVLLRLPGGPQGASGLRLEVMGVPQLTEGETLLALLERRDEGVYRLHGLMLGAFYPVQRGGQQLAVRDLSQAVELPPPGSAGEDSLNGPIARDWQAFGSWLEDRADGRQRAADYRVELTSPEIGTLVDNYTITRRGGRPSRIFEFDDGLAVPWLVSRGGQPGLNGGGFSQIRSAIDRWNAVRNANVRLRYDGETINSNVVEFFDDVNVMYFDDPNDDVTGTCRNAGVLAAAFTWAADDVFLPYNGRNHTRIFGADIITNNGGALCGFDDPTYFEIIITHEFGHTLGIGHSCDEDADTPPPTCFSDPLLNDAIMRATAQSVFRGPELGRDDIAAVQFLYNPGVTTPAAPSAPTSLEVSLNELDAVLSWSDNSNDEDGFRIQRRIGDGAFQTLGEVAADATSFEDPALAPETTYTYQVAAFRGAQSSAAASVTITTPQLVPVNITDIATDSSPQDRVIRLRITVDGPVERLEWETNDGEIGYADAPCAPGVFCFDRLALTDLSFSATLTAIGNLGQTDAVTRQVSFASTGGDPELTGSESLVQSAIFGRRGDTGTFQSHLWLHNAADTWTATDIAYLPRGLSNRDPQTRSVSLAPGRTIFLGNVLATLFGEDGGTGSLGLTSRRVAADGAPDVRAISRSFVELDDALSGSFGQFVGEDRGATFSAADKVVTGVFEGDDFISTLLAASLGDDPTAVEITLVDAAGQPVGSPEIFNLGVRAMRFQRTVNLFPQARQRTGPFTARFRSLDGTPFAASVTLLETGSEDQIFLPARDLEALNANPLLLPRIVRNQGLFDSFLISSLVVHNPSAVNTVLTLDLLLRGQDNTTTDTAVITVGPGETRVVDDVMLELFSLQEATGALRVGWANGLDDAPRVLSLAFATTESDGVNRRFGMLVDSRDPAEGSQQAVDFGAEQSQLFKASYGVVNLADRLTRVEVVLRDANGNVIATKRRGLDPFQHLELNLAGLFAPAVIGEGSSWTVTTEVVIGGPVITYLANINASGDVFFIPGRAATP